MHWIDLTIMAAFLIGCMVFGFLARGKSHHAEDYFTGGGKMTGFLNTTILGLSIAGTFFSGISFIIYPSVVYAHSIILPVWGLVVCMPVAFVVLRFWFLPRYLAGKWKFPYEILEDRFGPASRTVASALYILMRIGWMGAMIYAPTLAIITMCGLDPKWFWPLVLINGLANTFFTVFVGIRGVVIIEAIHMLVIAGGILATILSALYQLPVPLGTAISTLHDTGHFNIFDFSFDPRNNFTFFTIIIGVTTGNFVNYISDQMSLQRYLASGDGQSASRSFVVNIIGVTIVVSLLTLVGLTLFVFYHFSNEPGLDKLLADQVFPHFVSTHLPIGVAGLLLAALLSANSLPAAINTLSSILTVDFHSRLIRKLEGPSLAFWAKVYSCLLGVAATLLAGFMPSLGRSDGRTNLFELSNLLGGMFSGPLLSVVVLATFGIRSSGAAIIPAILLGWVAGTSIHFSGIAPLWIGPGSALTTLILGFALSRFIKPAAKSEENAANAFEVQPTAPTPITVTN